MGGMETTSDTKNIRRQEPGGGGVVGGHHHWHQQEMAGTLTALPNDLELGGMSVNLVSSAAYRNSLLFYHTDKPLMSSPDTVFLAFLCFFDWAQWQHAKGTWVRVSMVTRTCRWPKGPSFNDVVPQMWCASTSPGRRFPSRTEDRGTAWRR